MATSSGGSEGTEIPRPIHPIGRAQRFWMNLAPSDRGATTRYALFGAAYLEASRTEKQR